jgi:4-amino-4-deoxy-L-arabinose transferase-like glycosyltransferase
LVGALIYLPELGARALDPLDEGIYANIAKNMVTSGNWLVPYFGSHGGYRPAGVWFEKPPLVIWLEAISISTLGPSLFAARLPSALSAVGLGGLVAWIGFRERGWEAGLSAGLIVLTLPPLVFYGHGGFFGATDVPLTLFGSGFVYATWVALNGNPRWFYPAGVCAGLAVMTKGVAAGQFLIVLAPVVLFKWKELLHKEALVGATVAICLFVPWHLVVFLQFPTEVVSQLQQQTVSRATGQYGSTAGRPLLPTSNYPYLKKAITYAYPGGILRLPYYLLFITALVDTIRLRKQKESRFNFWLLWWATAIPVVFSLVGGNHGHYLLPMVVPLSLFLGIVVGDIYDYISSYVPRQVADPSFVVSGVLVAFLLVTLIGAPPTGVRAGAADQADLAPVIERELPEEATVYYPATIDGEQRLFATDYYTDVELKRVDTDERRPAGWWLSLRSMTECKELWTGDRTNLKLSYCKQSSV